ncbi:unnamed protein product [Adineta ricciae]|uniref:Uncharacterized protein n=1 Tax=Adineta ricciae TaxID=249248 RepID=A0A813RHH7_ADIRI|nr:unnamed protein product [Adineta ricciae]
MSSDDTIESAQKAVLDEVTKQDYELKHVNPPGTPLSTTQAKVLLEVQGGKHELHHVEPPGTPLSTTQAKVLLEVQGGKHELHHVEPPGTPLSTTQAKVLLEVQGGKHELHHVEPPGTPLSTTQAKVLLEVQGGKHALHHVTEPPKEGLSDFEKQAYFDEKQAFLDAQKKQHEKFSLIMAKSGGGSEYDFIFKVVLIGDSSVGKSNLLLRFTRNEFRLDTQSTIGVEFAYKQIIIEGKKIKTQVWDTAGQERFKTVIPQFYRGSEGALAVFDLTKPESFEHINTWIEELHRHTPADIPIVLVGNKSDLVDQRKVSQDQAKDLAQRLKVSYMETSALNASNVEQAFITLVKSIFYKKIPKSVDNPTTSTETDHSSTKPVTSDAQVEISTNTKSFRLNDKTKPVAPKKNSSGGGCC